MFCSNKNFEVLFETNKTTIKIYKKIIQTEKKPVVEIILV